MPKPMLGRLLEKCVIDPVTGCWQWTGANNGNRYGQCWDGKRTEGGRKRPVHQIAYEQVIGPMPKGLQIDHLCRNHACINPVHLEAVTQLENTRRAYAHQTHCKRGHPLSGENMRIVHGRRRCLTCHRARKRACQLGVSLDDWLAGADPEAMMNLKNQRGALRTHCKHGHPLSGDNLAIIGKRKERKCLTCDRARKLAYRRARPPRPPQTHCKRGHPLFGENMKIVHGSRRCLTCVRARKRAYRRGLTLP